MEVGSDGRRISISSSGLTAGRERNVAGAAEVDTSDVIPVGTPRLSDVQFPVAESPAEVIEY